MIITGEQTMRLPNIPPLIPLLYAIVVDLTGVCLLQNQIIHCLT